MTQKAPSELVGIDFDTREEAKSWLLDYLLPLKGKTATYRKYDYKAGLWIIGAVEYEAACERSYTLAHDARKAGITVQQYAQAADAFRNAKRIDAAVAPSYRGWGSHKAPLQIISNVKE